MKKIFLSIVLALATTVCTAQSVNDVIREFKGAKFRDKFSYSLRMYSAEIQNWTQI